MSGKSRSTFYRKRAKLVHAFLSQLEVSSDEETSSCGNPSSCTSVSFNVANVIQPRVSDDLHNNGEPSANGNGEEGNALKQTESSSVDNSSSSTEEEAYFSSSGTEEDCLSSDGYSCGSAHLRPCSSMSYSSVANSLSSSFENDGSVPEADDLQKEKPSLIELMKLWFVKYNITLAALGGLLSILRNFLPNLPKDPRTVLQSVVVNELEKMGGGEYHNFGLQNKLTQIVKRFPPALNVLELTLHHDGLPLFKSQGIQYYPILCMLSHVKYLCPPFVVTIYCGNTKPPLNEYLKDFAPELKCLLANAMTVLDKHYEVVVRCFICDAPAKSYIKGTIGHGGYHGCEFCEQRGVHNGRMTFPEMNAKLRTDESFYNHSDPEHHRERSALTDTGLKMISCFPLDYLHLILLGVMRKFMYILFDKSNKRKKMLPARSKRHINSLLSNVAKMWPSDFSRDPRSTEDLHRWKGTEFRQMLLYIGPAVFKSTLPTEMLNIFMLLHVSITILCREDLYLKMNDDAHKLLVKCVKKFKEAFSSNILFYNFHNLIHLAPQAKIFGPLDSFSSFPFESHLGVLKRLTKSTKSPLKMLVKKLLSEDDVNYVAGQSTMMPKLDGPVHHSIHFSLVTAGLKGKSFKKYAWHGTFLSHKKGDNCVIMRDGKVVVIDNVVQTTTADYIIGRKFTVFRDAYVKPICSSLLEIYLVQKVCGRPTPYLVSDVCWKAVLVPYKDKEDQFVCYPMRQ